MYGNVLSENANIIQALPPDSAALNTASDVINVALQHTVTFILQKGDGAVGTATLTVEACDDVVPTNQTAIPFQYRRMVGGTNAWGALTVATAAGFATTANADDMYEITVDPSEVTNAIVNAARGNHYVRLDLTQIDATACDHGVIAILPRQRYPQETPISAIV